MRARFNRSAFDKSDGRNSAKAESVPFGSILKPHMRSIGFFFIARRRRYQPFETVHVPFERRNRSVGRSLKPNCCVSLKSFGCRVTRFIHGEELCYRPSESAKRSFRANTKACPTRKSKWLLKVCRLPVSNRAPV